MDASETISLEDSNRTNLNEPYLKAPTKRLKEISEHAVQKGLSEADKSNSISQISGGHSASGGNRSKHELVISGRYTE